MVVIGCCGLPSADRGAANSLASRKIREILFSAAGNPVNLGRKIRLFPIPIK
jgi:ribosome biogenesis protein Tsr3